MWMIRAERDGILIRHFLNEGIAHLGWGVGPIHPTDTTADIRLRLEDTYPYENPGALPNIVGMLRRFSCEVRIGDTFVTYDPERRLYHIGIVKSDANPRVNLPTSDDFDRWGYAREVDWVSAISRDTLSDSTRRALNPQLSHYRISDIASAELRRLCG
jgi:restriction system protein